MFDATRSVGSATAAGTYTSANFDTLGLDYLTIDMSATTQFAST